MDIFLQEYFQALLSPAMQASLTEKLLIVAIIWATMARKVSFRFRELQFETKKSFDETIEVFNNHFRTIEITLANAVREMRELKETVSKDLNAHSDKLGVIESSITGLDLRVKRLESTKGEE